MSRQASSRQLAASPQQPGPTASKIGPGEARRRCRVEPGLLIARLGLLLGLTGLLAACGGGDNLHRSQRHRYRHGHDSTPGGPPPDVSKIKEPVPRVEPRSAYGNKSPYSVNGTTYRVLTDEQARHYVERGIASYYGSKFHGYKTSSLENYDMYRFSAAHKLLPLPSYARVTNLANGKSVIVRVNDRGPFAKGRLIDLSYVAAIKIGIWPRGSGEVEVRAIAPGERPPPAPTAPAAATAAAVSVGDGRTAGHGVYLQVASYGDAGNTQRAAARLQAANLGPVQIFKVTVHGSTLNRLCLGPFADADAAKRFIDRVEDLGFSHPKVELN